MIPCHKMKETAFKTIIAVSAALTLLSSISCGKDNKADTFQIPEKQEKKKEEPTPPANQTPTYEVGKVLPDWSAGYLDIHAINSGCGECFFYILPDGTTLLVDAGEVSPSSQIPQRPNGSQRPSETDVKYLQHFLPATGSDKLDYVLLTHFHIDHMGSAALATDSSNGYKHLGLCAIWDKVKFGTLLDRGWPSYEDDPSIYFKRSKDGGETSNDVDEYIKFAKYASANGTAVQRFKVGEEPQIKMTKGGEGKYDLKILNVIGNGVYLKCDGGKYSTGTAEITAENPASCGFHLRYGAFDILSCGDLTGAPQNRVVTEYYPKGIETLECFKAHHHMHSNSWGSKMSDETINFHPKTVLCQSFHATDDSHTTATVISKAAAGGDVFITNANEAALTAAGVLGKVKGWGGHFVVRVSQDGSFNVYQLDDTDNSYKIKAIFGPYTSTK